MICKVRDTIKKYNLIPDGTKSIAVGVSGGADSVCLLHILTLLKEEYGIIIKAVHVNHNIRGEEADADQKFVQKFCDELGVDLIVNSVDVPAIAKKKKLSLEECGRIVRYECFAKADCSLVAAAHTLSDSIETMIFNLARGTGSKGLTGINAKREPNIIRPLINCTRKEIEKYCLENELDYVTDSTNLSDDYTRNHIRHNIVPAFEKINVDFEKSFLRAMNSLKDESDYIEICVKDILEKSKTQSGYNRAILNDSHEAILKRSILEILKIKMSKPPEAKHIDACFNAVRNGYGKIEVGKNLYFFVDKEKITFINHTSETKPWKCDIDNNIAITPYGNFVLEETDRISDSSFDAAKIRSDLFLSSRLSGDKIALSSRGVTKTLKKLFNEMKIPVDKRNKIAILHDGENVVWIEDIGVNSMYIPDSNSQKIITIKKDGKIND